MVSTTTSSHVLSTICNWIATAPVGGTVGVVSGIGKGLGRDGSVGDGLIGGDAAEVNVVSGGSGLRITPPDAVRDSATCRNCEPKMNKAASRVSAISPMSSVVSQAPRRRLPSSSAIVGITVGVIGRDGIVRRDLDSRVGSWGSTGGRRPRRRPPFIAASNRATIRSPSRPR